ncbi:MULTISPECIES: DNA (cytosine-5-)-methyltransferase [Mesoplasma]|uniref:Cytosine-specific methyltransferase n=1 Tax=Mesoplasma florum TaxID=2151 RepID=A0A2R3P7C3_MESFO|nr:MULTISPECIES: DNA (cytosine-5-)-methyltransferase [Mesoplasma]AVN64361.1 DNA (cytosine-5-)-methyltransferase [Mesoplasma florum]
MQKIKVFETFSGIGAQHKALEILKSNHILDYEVVATSEWDIWANISYNAIHYNNLNVAVNLTNDELDSFLLKFTHSNDSKSPMSRQQVLNLPRLVKENLYSSIKNSNNLGSITEIKADALIKSIDNFDLLTYSFPCQDLSTAGSFHGNNKGMKKNSGTRSGLLWEIERILKELKKINRLPKYLLLENVNNMLSERHKDDYIDWLNFLNTIGYNTQTYALEANEYGTPQNRKRIFAFSVRKNLTNDFKDTFRESKGQIIKEINTPIDVSKKMNIRKDIFEVLKENYSIKKYKDEAMKATPNKTRSRKKMFENNKMLSTKVDTNINKHKNKTFIKDDKTYSKFSSTITTKQDRDPNGGVINLKKTVLQDKFNDKMNIQKANFRLLTPRECFLLMGFEEKDFQKILDISNKINLSHMKKNKYLGEAVLYRQSGNSIVVNVLVAIFNKIAEIEEKLKNEN